MNQLHNSTGNSRYLSFSLGDEEFAIPLLVVKEVIAVPEMTPVPHSPAYFLGIMNLRGQVVSVLDLRKKLSIKPRENSEEAIIICDLGAISLGVRVDSVNSVLSPASHEILPKPSIETKVRSEYIQGVYLRDNHLVLFLDIALALDAQDLLVAESHRKAS